jgi:hypothetical protein
LNHPGEVRLLRGLNRDELASFATDHGLNVVSRMGGMIFEFGHGAALA